MSIIDGAGGRDEGKRENSFPFKDLAILHMVFLYGLSLDIMIVGKRAPEDEDGSEETSY
jgi:hypothetical protein